VNGDTDFEADETFSLKLDHPVNCYIATSRATATILNDDSRTFSIAPASYPEGTGCLANGGRSGGNMVITLSNPVTVRAYRMVMGMHIVPSCML
jgi:hypothetical protein